MSMLKFAGKNNNGTASAIHVNNDGDMYVERVLPERELTYLLNNEEIRDTDAKTTVDVECDTYKYPVNAIVVETTLNAKINFILLDGAHKLSSNWLYNLDDEAISFSIPENSNASIKRVYIITDDNVPAIDNIKFLKLRYNALTVPTQGALTIKVIHKG